VDAQNREGPARVVFLDRNTMPEEIKLRKLDFPHELVEFATTSADEVAARIAQADVVITNKAPVRAAAIHGSPNLRMIAIAATGSDVVDIEACTRKGIVVSNIRDCAINTVPEHTFALIFARRRSIVA
jgi:glycerate dehydrogenase